MLKCLLDKYTEITLAWQEPPSEVKKQMRKELAQSNSVRAYDFDRLWTLPNGGLEIMVPGNITKAQADELVKKELPTVYRYATEGK
jgi:hypothetical protein